MTKQELVTRLKAIDERLDVVPNRNNPGLSNVLLDGRDVCPCPSDDIREESDRNYTYTFKSNGMSAPHNSWTEIESQVNKILKLISTKEGEELFFAQD